MEPKKEVLVQQLSKIMVLAKLIARSYGRKEILLEDFNRGRWLMDREVLAKEGK